MDFGKIYKRTWFTSAIASGFGKLYEELLNEEEDDDGDSSRPVDNTAPTITLLGDANVTLNYGSAYVDAGATAADDTDGNITNNIITINSVNSTAIGTYTVIYRVSDSAGNAAAEVTRTVNVVDNVAPTITLSGANPYIMQFGSTYSEPGFVASDNESGNLTANVVVTDSSNDITTVGSHQKTYTVQDNSGNEVSVTRDIVVQDNESPIIALTGSSIINLEYGTSYTEPGYSANDNADGDLTANVVVNSNLDENTLGSYTITYNVVDSNGNNATQASRTINVVDTTIPVITLAGSNNINLEFGNSFTEPGFSATDNHDNDITANVVVTNNIDENTLGSYTVTYDVADSSGNNAVQLSRTINVVDNAVPTISLTGASTITLEVGQSYVEPGFSASDNYDGNITSDVVVNSNLDNNTLGSYTITYNVSDDSGNNAVQQSRTINVVDTTAPVISLTGSDTINVEFGNTYTELGYSATDSNEGDLTNDVVVNSNVDENTVGSYTITYNVSDSSGNAATQVTRTVNIVDTSAPVITLTGSNTINLEYGSSYVEPGFSANDSADGDITADVVIGGDTVDSNTLGSYTITYNVADSQGNNAIQLTRTINVVDTVVPVITLTGSENITLEYGNSYVEPGFSASDNANGDITNNVTVNNSIDENTLGSYSITYNVADSSGNNALQKSRTVTIVDNTAPVITLTGSDTTVNLDGTYSEPGYTATDNYDGNITNNVTVTNNIDASTPGNYTVTYNVTDSSGNAAATVTRNVEVVDTEIPVITLNGLDALTRGWGDEDSYTELGATATDNVDGDISANIVIAGDTIDYYTLGDYVITYNVTDSNGNAAIEKTRTITIEDLTSTIYMFPSTMDLEYGDTWEMPVGSAYQQYDGAIYSVSDGIYLMNIDTSNLDTSVLGDSTVKFSYTNSNGRYSEYIITVTTVDTTAPVITLTGGSVSIDEGSSYSEPGFSANDIYDGDVTANVTVTNNIDVNTPGTYSVNYNVSDSNGNAATEVTRTVTVNAVDSTAPVITLTGGAVEITEGGTYTEPGYSATDDTDGNITANVTVNSNVDTSTVGTYTITYDVSDAAGNNAVQQSRTVTVVANTSTSYGPELVNNGGFDGYVDNDVPTEWTFTYDSGAAEIAQMNGSGQFELYNHMFITDGVKVSQSILTSGKDYLVEFDVISITQSSCNVKIWAGTNNTDVNITSAPSTVSVTLTANGSDFILNPTQASSGVLIDNVSVKEIITGGGGGGSSDTTAPVITLTGGAVTIDEGTTFTDPGYTATDDTDGDITANVTVGGTVDTSTPGTYTLTYDVSDAAGNAATQQSRTVTVEAVAGPPVITLEGSANVTYAEWEDYIDWGATAVDSNGNDITSSIVTVNNVDPYTSGTYTVTYDVTDAGGNAASTVTRNVTIAEVPFIDNTASKFFAMYESSTITLPSVNAWEYDYNADITSLMTIDTTNIVTNTAGEYYAYYDVTDSNGLAAGTLRTPVKIFEDKGNLYNDFWHRSGSSFSNDFTKSSGNTASTFGDSFANSYNFDFNSVSKGFAMSASGDMYESTVNTVSGNDYTVDFLMYHSSGNVKIEARNSSGSVLNSAVLPTTEGVATTFDFTASSSTTDIVLVWTGGNGSGSVVTYKWEVYPKV